MEDRRVSDARRRANAKWDRANMLTIACRLRRTEADAFKTYAQQHNTTVNALLQGYVRSCIQDDQTQT